MSVISTRRGHTIFTSGSKCDIYYAMDSRMQEIDLKRKLSLDEATDIVDSVFARRVINALRAKLSAPDVDRILKIMAESGLITKDEVRAVNEEIETETNGPKEETAAMDAMFPHQNRLGLGMLPERSGSSRMPTAAQDKAYFERFPHADRLK